MQKCFTPAIINAVSFMISSLIEVTELVKSTEILVVEH